MVSPFFVCPWIAWLAPICGMMSLYFVFVSAARPVLISAMLSPCFIFVPIPLTVLISVMVSPCFVFVHPHGLTFTWWGCYSLWQRQNQPSLPALFILFLCVFLSLWPFHLYLIPYSLPQLSIFSLCSSGLISALLVLSTIHLFVKVSFSPYIIHSCCLASKHHLAN